MWGRQKDLGLFRKWQQKLKPRAGAYVCVCIPLYTHMYA